MRVADVAQSLTACFNFLEEIQEEIQEMQEIHNIQEIRADNNTDFR